MGELDDRRLEAEIANLDAQAASARANAAKVDAERQRLSGSWRDWSVEAIKVFSALALGAGGLAAAVTGYQLSEVKKERTDLDITKAQTQLEELNRQKASTDAAVNVAQARLASIQTQLTTLQTTLQDAARSRPNGSDSLQTAIAKTQSIQSEVSATTAQLDRAATTETRPADLLVGVQTLGATDSEREDLNRRLGAAGYGLHELSASYGTRPTWFAQTSTVFYYSAASRVAAQTLARKLNELTGQSFQVQPGNGLGVDPSQRNITLFVHYIKS